MLLHIDHRRGLYIAILLFAYAILPSSLTFGQNLSFSSTEPGAISICETGGTFDVEFTNIAGVTLSGVKVNIDLPAGIEYVAGSVNESSGLNLQEDDISDLSNIRFSVADLTAGSTLAFSLNARANFDAFPNLNTQDAFDNTIKVSYSGGQESETTATYNVQSEPNLSVTASPNFDLCVDGSPDQQSLTIINNGSGPASSLSLVISPRDDKQYTRVDVNAITMTKDGATASLTPESTQDAIAYGCLGSNPKDGFTVKIPELAPGEEATINWDNYSCAATYCGDVKLVGWNYSLSYNNLCNSSLQTTEGEGQGLYQKNVATFLESPATLSDQEEGTYTLNVLAATVDLPETSGTYLELEVDVPEGLSWTGTASDLNISFTSGLSTWRPSNVYFNNNNRKLSVQYEYPMPSGFNFTNSTIEVSLKADCAPGNLIADVGARLYYIMDADCSTVYRLPLSCYESARTQVQCADDCEQGLAFNGFTVSRSSLGHADNDLDGLPDATNDLKQNLIKTNRVMVSDTFQTIFSGKVNTSTSNPSWLYGYARSTVPYGDYIEVVFASVVITDASTGQSLSCNEVGVAEAVSDGKLITDFDFSPATLALNCSSFAGFTFAEEDQVQLTVEYKVKDNPGAITEQGTIENEFYVTNTLNAAGFQCGSRNGNFTLVGYEYQVSKSEQYNFTACSQTVSQEYKMQIGAHDSEGTGRDIFPYEYRNWVHLSKIDVDIPQGYSLVRGTLAQWRSAHAESVREAVDISPQTVQGNTHTFDLSTFYTQEQEGLHYPDGGFRGKVDLELQPSCLINPVANYPMRWDFIFAEQEAMGGKEQTHAAFTPDYLKYSRATLELNVDNTSQTATGTTVEWNIEVNFLNADAENAWLWLDYAEDEMAILSVKNLSTNTMVQPVDGFYQLDNVPENTNKNFLVTIDYQHCAEGMLKVISGASCLGYPPAYEHLDCPKETLDLMILPELSDLQVQLDNHFSSPGACSDSILVELEMKNEGLANVEDLFVKLIQSAAQGIKIIPGTVEVLCVGSDSYQPISDPVANQGQYLITAADLCASLAEEGLPGLVDGVSSSVKLRMWLSLEENYTPEHLIEFEIGGQETCGRAIPPHSLVVSPDGLFNEWSNTGLSDAGDDWGSAWGDYDNDGYVDLFVVDYRSAFPNRLYRNQGDGTFSKITTGVIASDHGVSTGATWGDYDNDGNLDLFVSNSTGSTNFLYHNNGDGTFTRITNNPIVQGSHYSRGASWGDYDNDGFLDLFVADYFASKANLLYHNNGDGTFEAILTAEPALEENISVSGVWGDYNNDGLLDLFVTNTSDNNNSLYKNLGEGNFEKITNGAIVNDGGFSVGASWGDYNNDGFLDLFVANASNQNNFLYTNNGNGTFTKVLDGVIVNDGGHTHGSAWGDVDSDGDLDLFIGNDSEQTNHLYINNGTEGFSRINTRIADAQTYSFGSSWADVDNDLDIDLFVANNQVSENDIYQNDGGACQHKLAIVLQGVASNYKAIGAKVRIRTNTYGRELWQMREVSAQTGGGTSGQNDMKNIFGIGDATVVDSIIVEWPSGYIQRLANFRADQQILIVEGLGGKVNGTAFHDANNNCEKEESESDLANMRIRVQPGNHVLTTDESGYYEVYLNAGDYTFTALSDPDWQPACTPGVPVNVASWDNSYAGFDFAYSPFIHSRCLSVELSNTTRIIGAEHKLSLTYCNTSEATATGVQVALEHDINLELLESTPSWSAYDGTTATWEIDTLPAQSCRTIELTDAVYSSVTVGTPLILEAQINSNELSDDCQDTFYQVINYAIDSLNPNGLTVTPEGVITSDQELTYQIHFQNFDFDTITNLQVIDELPEALDVSTMKLEYISHAGQLDIQDERTLVWSFDNIHLPPSNIDAVNSNGFIYFRIKPMADLVGDTDIMNEAKIVFNPDDTLYTNMVFNVIPGMNEEDNEDWSEESNGGSINDSDDEDNGNMEEEEPDPEDTGRAGDPAEKEKNTSNGTTISEAKPIIYQAMAYPNPTVNELNVQIVDEKQRIATLGSLKLYALNGQLMQYMEDLDTQSLVIDCSEYPRGYYILELIDADRNPYTVKVFLQ